MARLVEIARRRAMTTFVQTTQPQAANAGSTMLPGKNSDDSYQQQQQQQQQQQRQQLPHTTPGRLQRFAGCFGSGDIYASRPRTFTLPAQRSISDAAFMGSALTGSQLDDLRSMLDSTSSGLQAQQPEQKQASDLIRRRTTKQE
eukprot:1148117-Pelagomonas_calceolata.AAC.3